MENVIKDQDKQNYWTSEKGCYPNYTLFRLNGNCVLKFRQGNRSAANVNRNFNELGGDFLLEKLLVYKSGGYNSRDKIFVE